tara:strand:- start:700 stop:990 length:291 start_codon:yes stop_codon:yes gene_type:complete
VTLIIPEKDEDVNIIVLYEITNYPEDIYIDLYFYTCFKNLTEINLRETGVIGNFVHLKSLAKLSMIEFEDTGVTGDENAFHEYRKSAGSPHCYIDI